MLTHTHKPTGIEWIGMNSPVHTGVFSVMHWEGWSESNLTIDASTNMTEGQINQSYYRCNHLEYHPQDNNPTMKNHPLTIGKSVAQGSML